MCSCVYIYTCKYIYVHIHIYTYSLYEVMLLEVLMFSERAIDYVIRISVLGIEISFLIVDYMCTATPKLL